jgi:hypothetical protein
MTDFENFKLNENGFFIHPDFYSIPTKSPCDDVELYYFNQEKYLNTPNYRYRYQVEFSQMYEHYIPNTKKLITMEEIEEVKKYLECNGKLDLFKSFLHKLTCYYIMIVVENSYTKFYNPNIMVIICLKYAFEEMLNYQDKFFVDLHKWNHDEYPMEIITKVSRIRKKRKNCSIPFFKYKNIPEREIMIGETSVDEVEEKFHYNGVNKELIESLLGNENMDQQKWIHLPNLFKFENNPFLLDYFDDLDDIREIKIESNEEFGLYTQSSFMKIPIEQGILRKGPKQHMDENNQLKDEYGMKVNKEKPPLNKRFFIADSSGVRLHKNIYMEPNIEDNNEPIAKDVETEPNTEDLDMESDNENVNESVANDTEDQETEPNTEEGESVENDVEDLGQIFITEDEVKIVRSHLESKKSYFIEAKFMAELEQNKTICMHIEYIIEKVEESNSAVVDMYRTIFGIKDLIAYR